MVCRFLGAFFFFLPLIGLLHSCNCHYKYVSSEKEYGVRGEEIKSAILHRFRMVYVNLEVAS